MGKKQPPGEDPERSNDDIDPRADSILDIKEAIRERDAKRLAQCLRETYGVEQEALQLIVSLLDATSKRQPHLVFGPRPRGRPHSEAKLHERGALRLKVWLKHQRANKKSRSKFENAVQDTMKEAKVSRATVLRTRRRKASKKKMPD